MSESAFFSPQLIAIPDAARVSDKSGMAVSERLTYDEALEAELARESLYGVDPCFFCAMAEAANCRFHSLIAG